MRRDYRQNEYAEIQLNTPLIPHSNIILVSLGLSTFDWNCFVDCKCEVNSHTQSATQHHHHRHQHYNNSNTLVIKDVLCFAFCFYDYSVQSISNEIYFQLDAFWICCVYGVHALALALLKSCIEIKFMGQEHDVKNYMTRGKKPIAPRQKF